MSEPGKSPGLLAASVGTNRNSISLQQPSSQTSTDPRLLSAYRARASKVLRRIVAARQKGEADKQLKTQRADLLAEEEVRAQLINEARKGRRETMDQVRIEHRLAVKDRARQYQDNKDSRIAEERARNQYMGGVAWGFDPTAGARFSGTNNTASAKTCAPVSTSQANSTRRQEVGGGLGRLQGEHCDGHGRWGIEHGGPGREGNYAHGLLRRKGQPEA